MLTSTKTRMYTHESKSFAVFSDDVDPLRWYVVAQHPELRRTGDGNELAFKFVKYRGASDAAATDSQGGGYCVFDVELAVPAGARELIKQKLAEELMKRPEDIRLDDVPFEEGAVKLNIGEKDDSMVQSVAALGKPSLVGSNVASFAAKLSQAGATLFESVLRDGGSGFVQVAYELKYYTRSEPATLKLSFSNKSLADVAHDFYKWENTTVFTDGVYRETLKQKLTEHRVSKCEVIGGTGQSPETVQKLTAYGQDLLDKIIEKQLNSKLAALTAGEIGVQRGGTNIAKALEQLESFETTISESSVMTVTMNPQGALRQPSKILGAAYQEKQYFSALGLDDPHFKKLQVAVTGPSSFVSDDVVSVKVELSYHGSSQSFLFAKGNDGRKEWKNPPYLEKKSDGELDREYAYTFEIAYKNGKRYVSPLRQESTTELLPTIDASEGVLLVNVSAVDVTFQGYDVVTADVTFLPMEATSGLPPVHAPTLRFASEDQLEKRTRRLLRVLGTDASRYRGYEYKLGFHVAGQKRVTPATFGLGDSLLVTDPFLQVEQHTARVEGLTDTEVAQLTFEYEDGDYVVRTVALASFDKQHRAETKIPVYRKGGSLKVWGTVTRGGNVVPLVDISTQAERIFRPKDVKARSVAVSLADVAEAWGHLLQIDLTIRDLNDAGRELNQIRKAITGSTPAAELHFDLKGSSYAWEATFQVAREPSHKLADAGDGDTLKLPLPPNLASLKYVKISDEAIEPAWGPLQRVELVARDLDAEGGTLAEHRTSIAPDGGRQPGTIALKGVKCAWTASYVLARGKPLVETGELTRGVLRLPLPDKLADLRRVRVSTDALQKAWEQIARVDLTITGLRVDDGEADERTVRITKDSKGEALQLWLLSRRYRWKASFHSGRDQIAEATGESSDDVLELPLPASLGSVKRLTINPQNLAPWWDRVLQVNLTVRGENGEGDLIAEVQKTLTKDTAPEDLSFELRGTTIRWTAEFVLEDAEYSTQGSVSGSVVRLTLPEALAKFRSMTVEINPSAAQPHWDKLTRIVVRLFPRDSKQQELTAVQAVLSKCEPISVALSAVDLKDYRWEATYMYKNGSPGQGKSGGSNDNEYLDLTLPSGLEIVPVMAG